MLAPPTSCTTIRLVRFGAIPDVARFRCELDGDVRRGQRVVVQTHRGLETGLVLVAGSLSRPPAASADDDESVSGQILRVADAADEQQAAVLRSEAEASFGDWQQRILEWEVDVQLIDLEWTFDRQKLILYVLNDRGPECTKLAIQAAAAGLGVIEVQPVTAEGLGPAPTSGGGCGSCGAH